MIKLDSVSEKQEQDLKPCPFCGGEGFLCYDEGEGFAVECSVNCLALTDHYPTETLAIAAWNIRTAADVAPVKHGRWVDEYDCGYTTPHCSECGEIALTKEETSYDYVYSSYCPRCGAKMGGVGE